MMRDPAVLSVVLALSRVAYVLVQARLVTLRERQRYRAVLELVRAGGPGTRLEDREAGGRVLTVERSDAA